MINILTIDCEDWYHTSISQKYLGKNNNFFCKERIYKNVSILLEILTSKNTRATFFVLGCIAEKYPKLILEIEKAGNRIGVHGYSHKMVFLQNKIEFENEINKSTNVLNTILSRPVESFRAPNWSINRNSLWAIEILKKYGFKYDSSMTHYIRYTINKPVVQSIIEFPRSHIKFLKFNIPFGGGAFLRLYPLKLTKYLISKTNKNGLPFMMYIHPWEVDNKLPLLKTFLIDKIIQYGGISSTITKVKKILSEFKFCPLEDFFEQEVKEKRSLNQFYYFI